MTGTVVTFYSFKGGVGRSFALANIAVLLARWGRRVLAIDWDLEAPGLHHYFAKQGARCPETGVVELVADFSADRVKPVADYVTSLEFDEPGKVDLIAAGRQDGGYSATVQKIDWAELYERGFAECLERCRAEWTANYDFVLIDSRTGISDIAGICTAHLPDRLVVVFTANEQSVGGAVDIAGRANAARDRLPFDRGQLTILPILSRVDNRVEYERAELWYRKCTELTAPLFRNWLVQNVPVGQMLRHHLTLPYVSYWTFGEQLAVVDERSPSTDQISYSLETIGAIIAQHFDRSDLLADNRDAYVAAARSPERAFTMDLRVSTPRSAKSLADQLVAELESFGVRARLSLSGTADLLDTAQDPARHLCLIVDGRLSRWQNAEAEQFMRHTLAGASDRRLFPVLTAGAELEQLPGFLRNLQFRRLGPVRDVARWLWSRLENEPTDHHQAYRDAADMVRQLPELLTPTRWELVGQTVLAMLDVVVAGGTDSLRDLTVDLELASRVRNATGERVSAPEKIRKVIADLVDKLESRSLS